MGKKQFKAESKRLLDLMINSIYTNKEIFIRELISNASDAIDKSYYKSLTDESVVFNREDYYIKIAIDKDNRTLSITDTGVGMTEKEMEDNLGIIAKSGSLAFKEENEAMDGVDIIGQFGVGFYSAFMVSKEVTVMSKTADTEGFCWESNGGDGYTIEPYKMSINGTEIRLLLKDNNEDEDFDSYLDEYKIRNLVKKYSDFIKYPIKMDVVKREQIGEVKDGEEPQYTEHIEEETLNSMVPLWRKNKSELTEDDYNNFYKEKHFGYENPLKYIHVSVDGLASYNAILYIPANPPYDFYTKDFQKGLELYSNGVLIMDKCADLLPDYFGFMQGLVDSADLSLNISREMLQQDKQLKFIAKKINEKIKRELLIMLKNDRDKYIKFFESFGKTLKFGIYNGWGANKEELQDLIMFYSSTEKALVTLDDYVSRMKEDQKNIYYATGDNIDKISKLPQIEGVADDGYEILYFTDEVDEFAIKMLQSYKEKTFKSVSSGDLDLNNEDKDEKKEENEQYQEIFDYIKDCLGDKVKSVKASTRLKTHPVCLVSQGELSIEMEKVLSTMPDNPGAKAEKVLEINTEHQIFDKVKSTFASDKDKLKTIANVLYNQALLIDGLPIDNPTEFANDVCNLI